MKKPELVLKEILVTLECIILGLGVILSYSGTDKAVTYSNEYSIFSVFCFGHCIYRRSD